MEFSPFNPIVKRCILGMQQEAQGNRAEATITFNQAWKDAANDLERLITAHHLARTCANNSGKLLWLQTALKAALAINDHAVASAIPVLHTAIADCYREAGDQEAAITHSAAANECPVTPIDPGPFYHGTKAPLQMGDLLSAGFNSNYQSELVMNHIYFTALLSGAALAAALAKGEGPARIYLVEPTGPFEDDPNVTNKKFPGNLTRSYRSEAPVKIIGELDDALSNMPGEFQEWQRKLSGSTGKIIN